MGNRSVDAEVREETEITKNETPKSMTEKPESFKAFGEHQQKSEEQNGSKPECSLLVYGVPEYFPPGKKHYLNGCSMFGQSSSSSDSDSEDSNGEESDIESINLGDSETKQDETPAEPKDEKLDLDGPNPKCILLVYGVPEYFPPGKKYYLNGCSMFGQSSSSSDSESEDSNIEESDDDSINLGDSETKQDETLAEPKDKRLDLDVNSAAKNNKPTEYLVKHGTKRPTEDVNKDSKRAKEMASQTEDGGKMKTEGIGNKSTDENTEGTKDLKVKHGTKRLAEGVDKDFKRAREMASQTGGRGNVTTDDENSGGS